MEIEFAGGGMSGEVKAHGLQGNLVEPDWPVPEAG